MRPRKNPLAAITLDSAFAMRCPQLPEEEPCPVEPKPPRAVDELELDDVELVPVLVPRPVDENAVETDVGVRRDWL